MSSADSTSSPPPSIHWKGRWRSRWEGRADLTQEKAGGIGEDERAALVHRCPMIHPEPGRFGLLVTSGVIG
jgi:hypothetical protein